MEYIKPQLHNNLMAKKENQKYSMEFGKKEKVLNYACQNYQLSRPNKVGPVMAH